MFGYVFRFIIPEVSSSNVLKNLIRSFRLELPSISSESSTVGPLMDIRVPKVFCL